LVHRRPTCVSRDSRVDVFERGRVLTLFDLTRAPWRNFFARARARARERHDVDLPMTDLARRNNPLLLLEVRFVPSFPFCHSRRVSGSARGSRLGDSGVHRAPLRCFTCDTDCSRGSLRDEPSPRDHIFMFFFPLHGRSLLDRAKCKKER